MRNFYKKNGFVYEFDVDQLNLVDESFTKMTVSEIDQHLNPDEYLSNEEKIRLIRDRMPTLVPMDFDLKLNKFGLYQQVQELIKTDIELSIAYNRALYFNRTDPFIEQARISLELSHEQVDEMWTS